MDTNSHEALREEAAEILQRLETIDVELRALEKERRAHLRKLKKK